MQKYQSWVYNELEQVGKDYSKYEEVEQYDVRHADFRDLEKESDAVLDSLAVKQNDVVIDFGAGTGTFAIRAAQRGATVYAVDVSKAMLKYAEDKASKKGVSGVTFCHGGFLSFAYPDNGVDVITTTFAFHHLPDFWKGIALARMYRMLKPGAQLYMHDVIIEEHKAMENIGAFIEELANAGGDFLREDAEDHFAKEFSTYDWVLDGLLTRAGFDIQSKKIDNGVLGTYKCIKGLEVTNTSSPL